jgi:3',5'-nucleoside bisphosphate phosphatase
MYRESAAVPPEMIDLHSHTTASDGTYSPKELIDLAVKIQLEALAITDHDTFAGYEQAVEPASSLGLDLICGIELSVKFSGRSIHVLAYFLEDKPSDEFRAWVAAFQQSRTLRNEQMLRKLQAQGIDITVDDLRGSLICRPHFARALMRKGIVSSVNEAFDRFLGEDAPCFVPREEPSFGEALGHVNRSGGLAVLAHPCRAWRDCDILTKNVEKMTNLGLNGIEMLHSDHTAEEVVLYQSLAKRFNLLETGGSDFHGETKPNIQLGQARVPRSLLDRMRY